MPFLADPSCQNCFAILTGEIPPKYFLEKLMHHVITSGSVLSKFNFDKARSRHNFSRKNYGGERGIRTLDTLLEYARFPGVCLQPLGHLSAGNKTLATRRSRINLFPAGLTDERNWTPLLERRPQAKLTTNRSPWGSMLH